MEINKFYTRVLNSLNVEVVDDYLKIQSGDGLVNYTEKGVPMVLPTRSNIGTVLGEDDAGEIVVLKHLFNPLDETTIKGDSVTLRKLKKLTEVRLGNRITLVGSLLLMIAENEAHQKRTGMLINKFLIRLTEAVNPGMTKIVDSKTIEKWMKLYDSTTSDVNKFLTVYVKKGGSLSGIKYNRVTTFKFPVYEALCKMEKGGKLNNVPLRNKDVKIFKILFEYLVEGINAKGVVTVGSNDKEAPGFISLFGLYLTVMGKNQEALSVISGVDAETEDAALTELSVSPSELVELGIYKRALAKIPREGDVIRTKLSKRGPDIQSRTNVGTTSTPETLPRRVAEEEASPGVSAIKKALYGNVSGINAPFMARQQPAYPPQQPAYPPQQPSYPPQQPAYPPQQPAYPPRQPAYPPQQPAYLPQQPTYPPQSVSIGAAGTISAHSGGTTPPPPLPPGGLPWRN